MDFDEIARDLYGRVPGEFTAARTQAVKDAKAAGDRELAASIQALQKPTVPAWAVNQLVRQHHAEIAVLLDLGRELRAGLKLSGEELRQLTKRRHQLVASLVDLARATAAASGQKLTSASADGVRATLEATLSDDDSAGRVEDGRLAEVLQSSGFGFGMPTAPAPRSEPADTGSDVADLDAHRKRKDQALERARTELELAEAAVEQAEALRAGAEQRLRKANDERDALIDSIARLRRTLERATSELDDAASKVKKRKAAKTDADRVAREAELDRADAEKQLLSLS